MTGDKVSPVGIAVFLVLFFGIAFLLYRGVSKHSGSTQNLSTSESPTTSEPVSPIVSKKILSATVTLKTSMGDIVLQLFPDKAPKTVDNFISLAKKGFYDGTKFHRVIRDFMIQGGDPISKTDNTSRYGTGGPGYSFADEINDVKLVQGTLAMANSGPDTNGSQFFIVTAKATPWLDGHHTAFGKVISGMDVVLAIGKVKTGENDLPVTPVVVNQVLVDVK